MAATVAEIHAAALMDREIRRRLERPSTSSPASRRPLQTEGAAPCVPGGVVRAARCRRVRLGGLARREDPKELLIAHHRQADGKHPGLGLDPPNFFSLIQAEVNGGLAMAWAEVSG